MDMQIDIIKPSKIFPNQDLVCLRTMVHDDPGSISTYLKVGGYEQLKKILKNKRKFYFNQFRSIFSEICQNPKNEALFSGLIFSVFGFPVLKYGALLKTIISIL